VLGRAKHICGRLEPHMRKALKLQDCRNSTSCIQATVLFVLVSVKNTNYESAVLSYDITPYKNVIKYVSNIM
jgi:hypothetical protein